MPLLKLETTVNLSGQSRTDLLTKLSRIVAETIGKPEKYVMVTVSHSDILMSGQPGTLHSSISAASTG
jgi:phenylpyruvate tautomerase PptA (4-oxalocrotonate tautomerase family)